MTNQIRKRKLYIHPRAGYQSYLINSNVNVHVGGNILRERERERERESLIQHNKYINIQHVQQRRLEV